MTSWTYRLAASLGLLLACLLEPVEAANARPTADAGADRTAGLGAWVILDGTASADRDGSLRRYRWVQTKGPRVVLSDPAVAAPGFATPGRLPGRKRSVRLLFRLTVTDDKKAKGKDTVAVTVAADPVCPAAQVLSRGVCGDPPVCIPPQLLQGAACVTPLPVCAATEVVRNGVCVDPTPVCPSPQVLRNGVCITPPPDCAEPGVLVNGLCTPPSAPVAINDSGFTSCSDSHVSGLACPLSLYPGQDAEFGRDRLEADDADGRAGFSFTKISAAGADLPADAAEWDCVRDNVTGLMWEVKRDDGGLRDQDRRYTQFSPSHDPAGGYGSAGDVAGLVAAVNRQGLCGASDWRLPEADELQGIVDYGAAYPGPAIDPGYFPHTLGSAYWSGSANVKDGATAWVVYFNDGRVFDDYRSALFPVRLVRGGTLDDAEAK